MSMQAVLNSAFQYEINAKNVQSEDAGHVYILGAGSTVARAKQFKQIVEENCLPQHKAKVLKSDKKTLNFAGHRGQVWILQANASAKGQHSGLLDESNYAWFREQGGALFSQLKSYQLTSASIYLSEVNAEALRAFIVGQELAQYNFLNAFKQSPVKVFKINFVTADKKTKIDKALIEKAQCEACAVQVARHLVNLPPNVVNPESVEQIVKKELNLPKSSVSIEVWDHKRLDSEGMHLHLAVGAGSRTPPRMVHIKYRPKKKSAKKPIAFVGKGITFDTGGLDIKPSSAMRLMKKDMGGAASVVGLAYWVAHSNYGRPCDFYLALAENSVDANAMRPSDVYKSRAGFLVEIDNTDAEGRLVLADVMDVAAKKTAKDEPEYLIDLATLTGAIKVALGADMAGLFSNDDKLADQIVKAGQAVGEPNWRMPLVQKYFGGMSSNFADFKNSADGFGGAITAALFLEKFCNNKKWAHLDIYGWTDKPTGSLSAAGGNGQAVQTLIQWLKTQV